MDSTRLLDLLNGLNYHPLDALHWYCVIHASWPKRLGRFHCPRLNASTSLLDDVATNAGVAATVFSHEVGKRSLLFTSRSRPCTLRLLPLLTLALAAVPLAAAQEDFSEGCIYGEGIRGNASYHEEFWTIRDRMYDMCAEWLVDTYWEASDAGALRECAERLTDTECDALLVADIGAYLGVGPAFCTGHVMSLTSSQYQYPEIVEMVYYCLAESNPEPGESYRSSTCRYDLYTVAVDTENMTMYCQYLAAAELAAAHETGKFQLVEGCAYGPYPKSDQCMVNSVIAMGDILGIYAADDLCMPEFFIEVDGQSHGRARDLAQLCRETVAPDWWSWLFGWF